jgi:hypothetical protein
MNGFIDHLYTRLGATSNYSVTANLHYLQITTVLAMPFTACYVFTSRSLATVSNIADSSASRAQVLSSQAPVLNSTGLTTPELDCDSQLTGAPQLSFLQPLCTENTVFNSNSIDVEAYLP